MTGKVGFCVGTGRCGTTLIAQLADVEPRVAASHERMRLPTTFHMFCKWHGIPADSEGFLVDRRAAVEQDLRHQEVSFESSALLSHSIAELRSAFDAKFVLLVRSPVETVASFAARGWFLDPIPWTNTTLPPTISEGVEPRHFFGRNLPRGAEFVRWSALTQIGKIAWFWQARNRAILDQFRELPSSQTHIIRLEEFDFDGYFRVAEFLGWRPSISAERFAQMAASKPNAGPNLPIGPADWSETAKREFATEVTPLASALGYDADVPALLAGQGWALNKTGPLAPVDVLNHLEQMASAKDSN